MAGFRWLGQVTGPTRDLDVYLLKLPGYAEFLPPEARGDLDLGVVVGVAVDEAGHHPFAGGLNHVRRIRRVEAHRRLHDSPVAAARPLRAVGSASASRARCCAKLF